MNKKYYFIFITLVIILFSNYSYAYNVTYNEIKINVEETTVHKIYEKISVSFDTSNLDFIEIPIVPTYDLQVKINNKKYTNIKYNNEKITIYLDNLEIDCKKKLNLEIVYLTDYYITKNNKHWNLKYYAQNYENIEIIELNLPINFKLKEITNFTSIENSNSKITIIFKNINEINVDYEINVKKNKTTLTIIILSSIAIIFTGVFLFFKKKKNIQKDNPLLLGLNENEQKIMKLIIEKEGQSQKQITIKSYLPKGTVSRNIKKLENKEYIEIKKYGISNKLFLGKNFKKK